MTQELINASTFPPASYIVNPLTGVTNQESVIQSGWHPYMHIINTIEKNKNTTTFTCQPGLITKFPPIESYQ